MSVTHGSAPTRDVVVSRLIAIDWIRRQLADVAPNCAAELTRLTAAGDNSRRLASMCSPETFRWLDTMVRLIDRDAPTLLPDGQFAAHVAAVVNLTAGLDPQQPTAEVRFDRRGMAALPAMGRMASGGIGSAGCRRIVELRSPSPGLAFEPLPAEPAADGAACDAGAAEPAAYDTPADDNSTIAVNVEPYVRRWLDEGGALAVDRKMHQVAQPPRDLLEAAESSGLPTHIEPNYVHHNVIRRDRTFDHLSLMSVRQPQRLTAIEAAAANAHDRYSQRISAHCNYIRRRWRPSAETYANLLLGDVADLDLWRDFAWAQRHLGSEQETRCWVMHPLEVVATARAVAFESKEAVPPSVGQWTGCSDRVRDFLRWLADDLR